MSAPASSIFFLMSVTARASLMALLREATTSRAVRGEEAGPQAEVEILDAGAFPDRRHVRGRRSAVQGRDREHLHLTGLDERQRRRKAGEIEVDMIAEQIGEGGTGALVGHVRHVAMARDLEQLAGEMAGRAGAGGGEQEALRA